MAKKVTLEKFEQEYSKMRWVLNGTTLHIQIKGKPYNRDYGMSLSIPLENFTWMGLGGVSETAEDFLRWMTYHVESDVKSRAGTGRDYTRGYVAVGKNRAGQRAILVRYADCHGCNYPLATKCGVILSGIMDWIEAN
jgi:hypothetical protein